MSLNKKRIVVICPGRGSYTAESLGYLRHHRSTLQNFIDDIDSRRRNINEPTISELDSKEKFSPALHTRGEHASPLIYACSYADFMSIDRQKYEIVAVCGNSMGWYLTLAFSGALDYAGAFQVIQTMGSMMKTEIIGGQLIYPVVNDDWVREEEKVLVVRDALKKVEREGLGRAFVSIELGGYLVIGGEKRALDSLQKILPKSGDYPFQLINHAAFHTPLLHETSAAAFLQIDAAIFRKPNVPIIDGRGVVWMPKSTDTRKLYEYTLGHQVYAPYRFTTSIEVALKEFMPDHLVLLGPGSSLGGAIGQSLIQFNWKNLASKNDFTSMQKSNDPFLLSMGIEAQKSLLIN